MEPAAALFALPEAIALPQTVDFFVLLPLAILDTPKQQQSMRQEMEVLGLQDLASQLA
jgi:hypothetical protein